MSTFFGQDATKALGYSANGGCAVRKVPGLPLGTLGLWLA